MQIVHIMNVGLEESQAQMKLFTASLLAYLVQRTGLIIDTDAKTKDIGCGNDFDTRWTKYVISYLSEILMRIDRNFCVK